VSGTLDTGALERRVIDAAEAALAERGHVSVVDVLVGMRWLSPSQVEHWRKGRVDCLEEEMTVRPAKLSLAIDVVQRWAATRGLQPTEVAPVARTRDRRALRFGVSGDLAVERAYRTHWVSPASTDTKRQRLVERQSRAPELVVVSPITPWTCASCSGTGSFLMMDDVGPLCLTCADLGHLVFLPSGDAALTRRAKKASTLSAVVVRFSRTRGRYERQGVLVEEEALAAAEEACRADAEARRRRGVDRATARERVPPDAERNVGRQRVVRNTDDE
jgi:hypothetical protein